MAKSFFDHLKGITTGKTAWDSLSDEDRESWSSYMANRWLSMNMDMTQTIDELQQYVMSVSSKHAYQLYYDILPNTYIPMKYVKSTKKNKYNDELVQYISEYYQVSRAHAMEYLTMLSVADIKDIVSKYGIADEDIDKLLVVKEPKRKSK